MSSVITCSKCGFATAEKVTQCPQCGEPRPLGNERRLRALGWVQVVLGLFLVTMMGAIAWNLAPSMLQPASSPSRRFTGTAEQAQLILGLFGLVIMFGLAGIANGAWQIVTGRRNRWIFIFMLVLTGGLIVAGWLVTNKPGR